jgi:hypothetical protein
VLTPPPPNPPFCRVQDVAARHAELVRVLGQGLVVSGEPMPPSQFDHKSYLLTVGPPPPPPTHQLPACLPLSRHRRRHRGLGACMPSLCAPAGPCFSLAWSPPPRAACPIPCPPIHPPPPPVQLQDPHTAQRVRAIYKPRVYGDAGGWHRTPMEWVAYRLNLLLGMDLVPPVAYRQGPAACRGGGGGARRRGRTSRQRGGGARTGVGAGAGAAAPGHVRRQRGGRVLPRTLPAWPRHTPPLDCAA